MWRCINDALWGYCSKGGPKIAPAKEGENTDAASYRPSCLLDPKSCEKYRVPSEIVVKA